MKATPIAWLLCGVAVVTVSIGVIARTLRKERALLEVDDPAAGSELFTIRGMLRQIRESLVATKQAMSFVKRRYWLIGGTVTALVLIATGANMLVTARHEASIANAAFINANAQVLVQPRDMLIPLPPNRADMTTPYKVERVGNRFRVEATLDDNGEIVVPMIGFATVPENWSATLDLQLLSGGSVGIVSNGAIKYISPEAQAHLVINACAGSRPLAVNVKQPHLAHQKVVFYVTPKLEPATCE